MANLPHFAGSGLPGVDRVPVGKHACHFYTDRDQLVAALVPYRMQGLRGNERYLFITAPPLPAPDAVQPLRTAYDGVDDAIQAGARRMLDFDPWYGNSGRLKGLDLIELWLGEERALAEGYKGLRIIKNPGFGRRRRSWSTNRL